MTASKRSRSRSAARLAAVQALYQQEMEGTPLPRLLKEFHDHRLGAELEEAQYHDAERDFFDDLTIVRLPDAGHFAPWEAPDAVARALAPFLASPATASAPAA